MILHNGAFELETWDLALENKPLAAECSDMSIVRTGRAGCASPFDIIMHL